VESIPEVAGGQYIGDQGCDVVLPGSKSVVQNEPKTEGLPSIVATRSGYCVSAQARSDGDGNAKWRMEMRNL
jgi:hypothetical protein